MAGAVIECGFSSRGSEGIELKRLTVCLLFLLAIPAATAWGAGIDLNLNGDAVRGGLLFPLRERNLELDFSYLHNEDTGNVAAAGLHVVDAVGSGSDRWGVGLGIKLFHVDLDNGLSGAALSIGGHLRYRWPNRVVLRGHAYWAPDVVSTDDLDRYTELALRVGYEVIDNATVYVGLRSIRVRLEGAGTGTVDDGAFLGVRFHW